MPAPRASRPDFVRAAYGGLALTSQPGERFPWKRAEELFATARLYWVVTVRPDGRPHAVPEEGLWLDGTFYFGAAPYTRRARNLARNPEIVVHLEGGAEAVIIEGKAERVADQSILARLADLNVTKYGPRPQPEEQAASTYALRPRTAYSWREGDGDFPETATRWRF